MNKLILALGLILSLSGCYNINKETVFVPADLITQEDLINILTDIQLVEAGFTISENRKYITELKPKYYQTVFDNYGITLIQLRENINYYQSDPKIMEEIYESVLANLSKLQSEVLVELEELERVQDSIANLPDSLNVAKHSLEKEGETPEYLKKKR